MAACRSRSPAVDLRSVPIEVITQWVTMLPRTIPAHGESNDQGHIRGPSSSLRRRRVGSRRGAAVNGTQLEVAGDPDTSPRSATSSCWTWTWGRGNLRCPRSLGRAYPQGVSRRRSRGGRDRRPRAARGRSRSDREESLVPRTHTSDATSARLGIEIRRARVEQGLTQAEFARRMGVKPPYVAASRPASAT